MGGAIMTLQHLSTVRDCFGVFEVTVKINGKDKEYTFPLRSQFDVDEFDRLFTHHKGKALNWLKNNCIR